MKRARYAAEFKAEAVKQVTESAQRSPAHSTVTLFAKFLGLSTSVPRARAV